MQDAYTDFAEFYDFFPIYQNRADVDFYLRQAREAGGPVLELGCGSGRILAPIAKAGVPVTGLDPSPAMLAACRRRLQQEGSSAELIEDDMRRFSLDRTFRLITIPFRPFQHLLEVDDQVACLTAIRRHLAPGGRLIFDVFDPDLKLLTSELNVVVPQFEFDMPDGRHIQFSFRRLEHDRNRQVQKIEFIFDTPATGQRLSYDFWIRYFFRFELEHLLSRCGFRIEALYGDFDGRPVSAATGELIWVASR